MTLIEGRPYRPSNGTEGEIFISRWCGHCKRDAATRAGDPSEGCEILARTMVLSLGETGYPSEWREVLGQPLCTAFLSDDGIEPQDPTAVIRPLL